MYHDEHLPKHLQKRFVYSPGKVTVRGLGVVPAEKQLMSLIEWLDAVRKGLEKSKQPELTVVG